MKKLCFVTLSRSDYASLKPVIQLAAKDSAFNVKVVAGGSHLLKRFGSSIQQIERDGIKIDKTISFLEESDDSHYDMAKALGRAYPQFVEYFNELKPDYIFILGDRWEVLASSTAAALLQIPLIHHSGGDITQGSLDNQTRYLLTIQSHLHLVALQEHRDRLIAMGEEEWRVIYAGEPALADIQTYSQKVSDIRSELKLPKDCKFVLATFHPTTFDAKSLSLQSDVFLQALDAIEEEIVLTAPNPDPGSRAFFEAITAFAKKKSNVHLFENLGTNRYYAALNAAEYMIGNSSSGIWEAPSFALPVINMGDRQKDRVRAKNVIDVKLDMSEIQSALKKVKSPAFRDSLKGMANPYVHKDTLAFILNAIKKAPEKKTLLEKKLVDPLLK
jgi:UDP-hydrolysing UDP-N-acetyl-D-glucosamine 2-epimerase